MKTSCKLFLIASVCWLALSLSTALTAQTTNLPPPAPSAGTNVVVAPVPPVPPAELSTLWNSLIAIVVPLAVAGIKKVLPNIPKMVLPLGAAALGVVANWLMYKAGALTDSSWALGALCGAAGVGVREISTQSFGTIQSSLSRSPTPDSSGTTPTPPPAAK